MKRTLEDAKIELIVLSEDVITTSSTNAGTGNSSGDGPGL